MSIRPKKPFSSRRALRWLFITLASILLAVVMGMQQPPAGVWRFGPEMVHLVDFKVPFWRTFQFETQSIGAMQPYQPGSQWPDALAFEYQFGTVRIPSHGRDKVADFNDYLVTLKQHIDDAKAGKPTSWLVRFGWQSVVTALALFASLVGIIMFFRQFLRPASGSGNPLSDDRANK